MALQDLLNLSSSSKKVGLSEERIAAIVPVARNYVAYWREYPDMFIDFMGGENSTFKLYFYQRVFLRAAMRHKYLYAVFPRAYENAPARRPLPRTNFFNCGNLIFRVQ